MIDVLNATLHSLPVKTRMPFRYGIAVLTGVPHLLLELTVLVDEQEQPGLAADNLPPKWFVKNPNEGFSQELDDMHAVISHACDTAKTLEPQATVFDVWRTCYEAQRTWADAKGYPPLLWQFGLSLVERALVDAYCRAKKVSFAKALRNNLFGLDLGYFSSSLNGKPPAAFLPEKPLTQLHVRHTVGLSDPLTDADIASEDRADDTLPQSLEATLDVYGLTHLKLKLSGKGEVDFERLESVATILKARDKTFLFTLDGNEQYTSSAEFRDVWQALNAQASLRSFLKNLLFIEQPFGRDMALSETLKEDLLSWKTRPPIIIDESDAGLDSLEIALAAGYAGTSHKNCKGIFKSVANAARLQQKRDELDRSFIMSGEDLTNIGPVALQQDLAVLASLGISHAERNGHHYFKGLSMFLDGVQTEVLRHHRDLYQRHDDFVSLNIQGGKLDLSTVVKAPFGLGHYPDAQQFDTLNNVIKQFQG